MTIVNTILPSLSFSLSFDFHPLWTLDQSLFFSILFLSSLIPQCCFRTNLFAFQHLNLKKKYVPERLMGLLRRRKALMNLNVFGCTTRCATLFNWTVLTVGSGSMSYSHYYHSVMPRSLAIKFYLLLLCVCLPMRLSIMGFSAFIRYDISECY